MENSTRNEKELLCMRYNNPFWKRQCENKLKCLTQENKYVQWLLQFVNEIVSHLSTLSPCHGSKHKYIHVLTYRSWVSVGIQVLEGFFCFIYTFICCHFKKGFYFTENHKKWTQQWILNLYTYSNFVHVAHQEFKYLWIECSRAANNFFFFKKDMCPTKKNFGQTKQKWGRTSYYSTTW